MDHTNKTETNKRKRVNHNRSTALKRPVINCWELLKLNLKNGLLYGLIILFTTVRAFNVLPLVPNCSGKPISFNVLLLAPLVILLVPMVPLATTVGCQCVRSWFYQWYTNIVQGSTNGTIDNIIGNIGKDHW